MDTTGTKKSQNRVKKETIVAELVEKLDNSSGLVFADYQGLTHKQLEDLKKELKKLDSTIIVAKNSLLKLSLAQSSKYADYKDNEGLNQPTATLFLSADFIEPLKKLQKTIKDLGLPKIKFGILEGQLLDNNGVLKLASLPSRETLLAQLVGTLNSPISGLVMTLNANISKFVMTLNAIAQTKPAVAAVAAELVQANAPADLSAEASAKVEEANTEATVEPVVEAAQADAPVETDESADAGTETEPTQTDDQKPSEQTEEQSINEGGEDK